MDDLLKLAIEHLKTKDGNQEWHANIAAAHALVDIAITLRRVLLVMEPGYDFIEAHLSRLREEEADDAS